MAYMNQERKAVIAAQVAKLLPKSEGWGYSLSVRNHSTICLTIRKGPLDFMGNIYAKEKQEEQFSNNPFNKEPAKLRTYCAPNEKYLEKTFSGACLALLEQVVAALNTGNWDKSDIMTDYFNVGWYVDLCIGRYDSAYLQIVKAPKKAKTTYAKQLAGKIGSAQKTAKAFSKIKVPEFLLPDDYQYLTPIRKAWATRKALKAMQGNFNTIIKEVAA